MKKHEMTWNNYRKLSIQRGQLVADIISLFSEIKNITVLDIGCGEGGTSLKLDKLGANVTAVDIRTDIKEKFKKTKINFLCCSIDDIFFNKKKYDVIILQDVLEHLPDPEKTIKNVRELLSKTGIIYISTPNRFSLLNIISDPHWHLPLISLFPRKWVKLIVNNMLRIDCRQREDWAALLSLFMLKKITKQNQLKLKFVNSFVAKYLLQKPEAIICKKSHLSLIHKIEQSGIIQRLNLIVNNKFSFFNYFINPTWYLIGRFK